MKRWITIIVLVLLLVLSAGLILYLVPKDKTPEDNSQEPTACVHVNTVTLEGISATCTEAGRTEGSKCIDCGEFLLESTVIEALGHNHENGYCSQCGDLIVDDVDTSLMTEVELKQGEKVAGGFYRLYGIDGAGDGGYMFISGEQEFSIANIAGMLGIVYVSAEDESTYTEWVHSDWEDGMIECDTHYSEESGKMVAYIDIYIPDNFTFECEKGTFSINENSTFDSYRSSPAYSSGEGSTTGIYRLEFEPSNGGD